MLLPGRATELNICTPIRCFLEASDGRVQIGIHSGVAPRGSCSPSAPPDRPQSGNLDPEPQPDPNTIPPVLTVPDPMTLDATGPNGAVVTYSATATDETDGSVPVSCSPASGSTFPIGTTEVSCSAEDAAGNAATASFSVTVKGAADQVSDLTAALNDLALPQGTVDSLRSKLDAIQKTLSSANSSERSNAKHQLDAFINSVNAQKGKKLTDAEAQQLLDAANRIKGTL